MIRQNVVEKCLHLGQVSNALMCWITAMFVLQLSGCHNKSADSAPTAAPMVAIAPAVERDVTQYEFFTGRVEAPEEVEIRARVSGYLKKIFFKPGVEIQANLPLFEIDQEPFKADLAKAEADLAKSVAEVPMIEAGVARAEAQLVRAKADFKRSEKMLATNAVSPEEFDKSRADMLEAEAIVKADKARVEASKAKVEGDKAKVRAERLNLGYCSINAPISGRIGDTLVTEGNLISGGTSSTTLLTTLFSVDPMFATFDVDENTLQRIQKVEREGRVELGRSAGEIPAEMGLAIHETEYPNKGTIKFVNNQVDSKTGTIRVKAEFANAKPPTGTRLLAPGMFARIRIPIGKAQKAMLIPDAAVLSDQGVSYALVVDKQNKAARLDLEPGAVVNGFRVVNSVHAPGDTKSRPVNADDRFIVSGLQRVRAGMVVDPKTAASK
jgi:membrane fusion protein, multidrug efflux system